jgi:hypothetical protein
MRLVTSTYFTSIAPMRVRTPSTSQMPYTNAAS